MQSTLSVQSATIVGLTAEPVIVTSSVFENSSDKSATFSVGVTDSVTDTVENSWSETHGIELSQSISYEVGFLGSGGGGETSISYNAEFGTAGSQSTSVTVGSNNAISVDLDPGQSVTAVLSATRGKLQVQITYQVALTGVTAVNYNPTFKGHHFWALDINGVMQAGGIPIVITITETVEVSYYGNAKIQLQNLSAAVPA